MKLPLMAIKSTTTLLSFVAISSLFLSSVSAKEVLKNQDLIIASKKGDIYRIKDLLERKDIDVNAGDAYGYTALVLASVSERADIVKILLGHKDIDVNAGNSYGKTALMWASTYGRIGVVELLSEHINKAN